MGIIAVGENCKFLTELSLRFCDRYEFLLVIFSRIADLLSTHSLQVYCFGCNGFLSVCPFPLFHCSLSIMFVHEDAAVNI